MRRSGLEVGISVQGSLSHERSINTQEKDKVYSKNTPSISGVYETHGSKALRLLKMQAHGSKAQEQGGAAPRCSFFELYKDDRALAEGIEMVQEWTDDTVRVRISASIAKVPSGSQRLGRVCAA